MKASVSGYSTSLAFLFFQILLSFNINLYELPLCGLTSGFVGLAIGSMTVATSITLQNVTHIRGNDTLEGTEPGKSQPSPNDFSRIKSLVESIKIIATIFSALSFTAGMQISTAHLGRIGSQKANRRKR